MERKRKLTRRDAGLVLMAIGTTGLISTLQVVPLVLVHQIGATPSQIGTMMSLFMGAVLAGGLATRALIRVWSDRVVMAVASAMMLAGCLCATLVGDQLWLMAVYVTAALATGVGAALASRAIGQSGKAEQLFAFWRAGEAVIGILGMGAIVLVDTFGWRIFYVLITILSLPALLFARCAVTQSGDGAAGALDTRTGDATPSSSTPAWIALACLLFFIVGVHPIWTFLEHIGEGKGLSSRYVASVLAAAMVGLFIGSAAPGVIGERVNLFVALAVTLCCVVGSLLSALGQGQAMFAITAIGLSMSAGCMIPLIFACIAELDRDGRVAALAPSALAGGSMLGSFLGGYLFDARNPVTLVSVCVTLTVLATTVVGTQVRRSRLAGPAVA